MIGKTDKVEPFLLERYRYVLEQKRQLNGATFRIAATYQALLLATGGGAFAVIERTLNESVPVLFALLCLRALTIFVLLLGAFGALMVASGIVSWLKYRRDEADIEVQVYSSARPAPVVRNIFRWYETYILMMIVVSSSVAAAVIHFFAIPLVRAAGG
jgi:uncharacterized iron-regulated membrane protein